MLIDNKIMKSVENERSYGEIVKSNNVFGFSNDAINLNTGNESENSSNQRVYEDFDVKNTKSIMLRKLYDELKGNKLKENLTIGELIKFKDVQLTRRNLNDMILLLSVLQDSKIKNKSDNSMEINMNKMLERVLDDFTIDYVFNCGQKQFILQLPYNLEKNFKNGYNYHDLQVGKLSVIGIYRGNIDFKENDTVSSKFLKLMDDGYNKEQKNKGDFIKNSRLVPSDDGIVSFEFKHEKLEGFYHLVDVIAIIQELNFSEDN